MTLASFYKLQAAQNLLSGPAQLLTSRTCRSASANPARAVTVSYGNPVFRQTAFTITSPHQTRTTELRAASATQRFLSTRHAEEAAEQQARRQKQKISELKQRDTCYRLYEHGYQAVLKKQASCSQAYRYHPYQPETHSRGKPRYLDYIEEQERKLQERQKRSRSQQALNQNAIDSSRRIYEKQHARRMEAQNKAFLARQQQEEVPDTAFRPRIDENSRYLTQNQEPFLQKMSSQLQYRDQRLSTLRTQKELRELENCPFQPEINDNAVRQDGSAFDRLYAEGMNRLAAIQQACAQASLHAENSALQQCTFTPKINDNAGALSAQRAARIIYEENARQCHEDPGDAPKQRAGEFYESQAGSRPSVIFQQAEHNNEAEKEAPAKSTRSVTFKDLNNDRRPESSPSRSPSRAGVYERGMQLKDHQKLLQDLSESTSCLLASSAHCSDESAKLAEKRLDRFLASTFAGIADNGSAGCLQLSRVQNLRCQFEAKKLISEILIENASGIGYEQFRDAFLRGMHAATGRGEQINVSLM